MMARSIFIHMESGTSRRSQYILLKHVQANRLAYNATGLSLLKLIFPGALVVPARSRGAPADKHGSDPFLRILRSTQYVEP
jgi:hypothetical protein